MKLFSLIFLGLFTVSAANSDGRFVFFGQKSQPTKSQPTNAYNTSRPILQEEPQPKKTDVMNTMLAGQSTISQPTHSYNMSRPVLQEEPEQKKIDIMNMLAGQSITLRMESNGTVTVALAAPIAKALETTVKKAENAATAAPGNEATTAAPSNEATTPAAPSNEATTPAAPVHEATTPAAPSNEATTLAAPSYKATTPAASSYGATTPGAPSYETTTPAGESNDTMPPLIEMDLKFLNISSDVITEAEQLRVNQSAIIINDLVNIHMVAYYQYLAMAAYYNREDVALKGFANLYRALGADDHKRVQKMIQFQHHRSGEVDLRSIKTPASQEWKTPRISIDFALALERRNRRALNAAHGLAIINDDPHFRHFIEEELLHDQIEEISRILKHQAHMKLVGDGLGVFMLDKDLMLVKEGEESEEELI